MRVIVTFCTCLFILIGAAAAQHNSSDTVTVRGCLKRSRQNYIVVERQGLVYALKNAADKLDSAIGHEVEVAGKVTNDIQIAMRPHRQSNNLNDTVRAVDVIQQALSISGSIRTVSDHCSVD